MTCKVNRTGVGAREPFDSPLTVHATLVRYSNPDACWRRRPHLLVCGFGARPGKCPPPRPPALAVLRALASHRSLRFLERRGLTLHLPLALWEGLARTCPAGWAEPSGGLPVSRPTLPSRPGLQGEGGARRSGVPRPLVRGLGQGKETPQSGLKIIFSDRGRERGEPGRCLGPRRAPSPSGCRAKPGGKASGPRAARI